MGFGFFVLGAGALIGSPIQGALLGSPYVWWKPAVFVACALITGVILLAIGRALIQKRLATQRI